jgi:hypothetical protein
MEMMTMMMMMMGQGKVRPQSELRPRWSETRQPLVSVRCSYQPANENDNKMRGSITAKKNAGNRSTVI